MTVHIFEILFLSYADGLIYFGDLMEEVSLLSILSTLEKNYKDATRNKSEFDETIFLYDEDRLLGSGSLSGGAINLAGAKVCLFIQSS